MGSVSISVLISRMAYGTDIRECGSGNAGTANVLRTFGWKPALAVFVVDVGKGGFCAFVVPMLQVTDLDFPLGTLEFAVGAAAVLGHCYPLFPGFRGGKGVATAAGVLLVTYPFVLALCSVVFLVVIIASRVVSMAAVVAALSAPAVLLVFRQWLDYEVSLPSLYIATGLSIFVVCTHRSNLVKLWNGSEKKVLG